MSNKVRGVRNPFPKVKPATNSGIFSNSGAGQKQDPVSLPKTTRKVLSEAYGNSQKPPSKY